jgi:hypothetical protein
MKLSNRRYFAVCVSIVLLGASVFAAPKQVGTTC